jgi:hypothetical protein
MARRGYPPEFRRRVVELVEGGPLAVGAFLISGYTAPLRTSTTLFGHIESG